MADAQYDRQETGHRHWQLLGRVPHLSLRAAPADLWIGPGLRGGRIRSGAVSPHSVPYFPEGFDMSRKSSAALVPAKPVQPIESAEYIIVDGLNVICCAKSLGEAIRFKIAVERSGRSCVMCAVCLEKVLANEVPQPQSTSPRDRQPSFHLASTRKSA